MVDQLYRMEEYNRDVVEIGIKFARANIYGTRSEQFLRHKCGRNPNKIRSCKYYGTPSGQLCVTYVVEIRPARMKFARANMTVSAKNLASLL